MNKNLFVFAVLNRSFLVKLLLFNLLLISLNSFSLNYTIGFTGSGASSTVESVIVQNLTKGILVTVPAGNVLNLTDITTEIEAVDDLKNEFKIFTNPSFKSNTVSFYAKTSCKVQINIYSLEGRVILNRTANLLQGMHSFNLVLPNGIYFINIQSINFRYNSKIISNSNESVHPLIEFTANVSTHNNKPLKSKSNVTSMLYSVGDQILYKGISGNYVTIVIDKPTGNKVTNFEFVECKDADNNYYATVKIGSQLWMAENLKTTKYRTNENISSISNNNFWSSTITSAYCNYNNDTSNGLKYGKLYNWYSVSDNRNIAPNGWHIPTDAEFTSLIANTGGESSAGGKLKESGTQNWLNPNTDANNESGFTALPSGNRNYINNGLFDELGQSSYWWSSTPKTENLAYGLGISYDGGYAMRFNNSYSMGAAVRCVKDILPTINTLTIESIRGTTASSGGTVTNNGGAPIISCGVCWSLNNNPTINDNKTIDALGTGTFNSSITGLTPNMTYYVRSYATNSVGTAYGNEISFKTDLKLLELYQGGKVAYIFKTGDVGFVEGEVHGLIVALVDQSTGVKWGNFSSTNATDPSIGAGMTNTVKIINSLGIGSYAAKICDDLVIDGFSDWYLPSIEELRIVYQTNFVSGQEYWSSTEISNTYAACKVFGGVAGAATNTKSTSYRVRAIRTF